MQVTMLLDKDYCDLRRVMRLRHVLKRAIFWERPEFTKFWALWAAPRQQEV